jgi:hypothetical protein
MRSKKLVLPRYLSYADGDDTNSAGAFDTGKVAAELAKLLFFGLPLIPPRSNANVTILATSSETLTPVESRQPSPMVWYSTAPFRIAAVVALAWRRWRSRRRWILLRD